MLSADQVVQGALAGHAFAQAEVAAYTALVAAAQAAGEAEIRACCEWILQQACSDPESAHDFSRNGSRRFLNPIMAAWPLRRLPALTTTFLDRSAAGRIDAKR
ncbi:DUF892 family protein [Burkholderia sp. AU30280]|uniref:DUF892 family protein n=1 Tax=Burkholderia sp. AU30280 TaxID=2879628 RepID=UPI001CF1DF98|nr:DUF892 family protein [Burkholderia sp. AU30280]MCA8274690.1 DUF892 family protein [Burkholderia sp. AU30280]